MTVRKGGKITVYVPDGLMSALGVHEETHGEVNLSALMQEAIRRRVGQLNSDDQAADRLAAALAQLKRHDALIKTLQRDVKAIKAVKA